MTGLAGILAVRELVSRLGVIDTLDDYVGGIKQRDRGLSAGQFLVALAQAHMQGIGPGPAAYRWVARGCRPRPRLRQRRR